MEKYIEKLKVKTHNFLRWTEKYTKTDMVYLAKGGFWLTLGQIISSTSSFLLSIAFANLLLPETYGTYKYVLSIAGLLTIFTLPGMNTALTRSIAQGNEGSVIPALKTKIKWGLWGGITSLIITIYYFTQNNYTLTISFAIAAFFLPFMDSFNIYAAILHGKKDFRKITLYSNISQIIATLAIFITIFLTKNLFIIIASYFIIWTIVRFTFLKLTLKNIDTKGIIDQTTLLYGKHLSFINIINSLAFYLDRLLLFHYVGPAQLAIYSIAIAPVEQLKAIIKNLYTLALPRFAERTETDIRKKIWNKTIKLLIIVIIISLTYIILSPFIFETFFPKYSQSIFLSQIYTISLLGTLIIFPYTLLESSANKNKLYSYNIISSLIQIIALLLLTPFYGVMGVVIARIINRLLNFAIITILIK